MCICVVPFQLCQRNEFRVIFLQIREYHRRHPAARVVDAGEEYEQMFKEDPMLDFSGEVFGL